MASQPRKFSEKIALHNQKQAEGDAAFQQIMREVTDVTSNVSKITYVPLLPCIIIVKATVRFNFLQRIL